MAWFTSTAVETCAWQALGSESTRSLSWLQPISAQHGPTPSLSLTTLISKAALGRMGRHWEPPDSIGGTRDHGGSPNPSARSVLKARARPKEASSYKSSSIACVQ